MTSSTVIHSAEIIDSDGIRSDSWIEIRGTRLWARGTGTSWRRQASPAAAVVDARGSLMCAGFIDLHCHGGGGASVTSDIATVLATHVRHGTTRLVASLVSAPVPELCTQLAALARTAGADPRLLGSHLEGPFLEPAYRGAHDPAAVRDATSADIDALVAAADGTLVQVTVAPERAGGREAIAALRARGIVVAIGHTAADLDHAAEAFRAGATVLTHAFNGMPGLHHRAPGPVLAAVHSPDCTLEVISDGVHVHPDMVNLLFRLAPGRVALVTDAMAAAGAGDGHYRLGSLDVRVHEGVARLAVGDSIAGSTLTMDAALRHTVQQCGVPVHEAVAAITSTPARTIGRAGELGHLRAGYRADVVVLRSDLTVDAVWVDGLREV